MKSTMLRMLAALFALTLVAAACGSDDDDSSSESTETTAAPVETDAPVDEAGDEEMTDEEMSDEEMSDEEMTDEEMTDDGEAGEADIVTVAVESGEFPTLVAALEAADLVETLQGPGPFTVFAPTEEAFADALAALDVTAEELLADPNLGNILTYHVVPDEVGSDAVVGLDGAEVETVNGETIEITVTEDGAVLINDEATVVQTDIQGSNGVIHVIDTVLLPPAE